MSRHDSTEPDPRAGATLSKELSEFLLEFSIGVHRYAMYPPDHPAVEDAGGRILAGLQPLLLTRDHLAIGVAQQQLVIEGVATDAQHPVLSDLARRLHGHQLGAVTFSQGASGGEVVELLRTLSADPDKDGDPLGLLPRDELPTWDHIRIFPLGYDRLEFRDGESHQDARADRATQLWLGLARSAMASEDGIDPENPPDSGTVARSIQAHRREAAYDQVIVGYLLQLAKELREEEGAESKAVRQKVSGLIRALDQATLRRIVEMGGISENRRQFLLNANQSLAVDSVIKILEATASASNNEISTSLTRLLSKLSHHAEAGTPHIRDQADQAFRENVEGLLSDWKLKDPNPDRYNLVLDAMAKSSPALASDPDSEGPSGSLRLLQMSVELDTWGPTLDHALDELLSDGELADLLAIVSNAPEENTVVGTLRERLTDPERLRRLLARDDVEEETLRGVVQETGPSSIPVLLDALAESESRSVRRKVFDVLVQAGEAVGPSLAGRLDDERWYVVRNLLALVQKLPTPPAPFSAYPFLTHEDVRVRREAYPLAFRDPSTRDEAILAGLSAEDDRILRLTFAEVNRGVPEPALPIIVERISDSSVDPELRAGGIRAVQGSSRLDVLEALLQVCSQGKTLFGKVKLADPGPDTLAALKALAHGWAGEPRADVVLQAARASKDPKLREAASVQGGMP